MVKTEKMASQVKKKDFHYYSRQDVDRDKFYQLPKELFMLQRYANLSNNACVLYAMLKDRLSLSIENNWIDKDGNIYFIFSRESAAEMIRLSERTTIKVFQELTEVGLLYEYRLSRTSAKLLYLGQIINDGKYILRSEKFSPTTCNIFTSGHENIAPHDMKNFHPNNTEYNDTEINDTELNNNIVKNSVPYEEIVNLFNSLCSSLPKVKIISDKRKNQIKKMYIALKKDMATVTELFTRVSNSDFLQGKNDKNWKCSFDWVIDTNNMVKILEGNYESRSGSNGKPDANNPENTKYGDLDSKF